MTEDKEPNLIQEGMYCGTYEIAGVSSERGDFFQIIRNPTKKDLTGILLVDTPGHFAELGNFAKEIFFDKQNSHIWYSYDNPLKAMLELEKRIARKTTQSNKKNCKLAQKIEMSSLLYALISNEKISFIDVGIPYPIYLTNKENLNYIEKAAPPLGALSLFLKKSNEPVLIEKKLEKGDIFLFKTDGVIDNAPYSQLISPDNLKLSSPKDIQAYDTLNKKEMKSLIEQTLIQNREKSPKEILNILINKYKKNIFPYKEPEDDATLIIIKKVS